MKLYRLYTEDINRVGITSLVNEYFENYTVLLGTGVFEKAVEESLIIEIAWEGGKFSVLTLANKIAMLNDQDCVMVTEQEIECTFVTQ